jgi:hypothetical protein
MPNDTMTAFERLRAAVNLEPTDRVPVYPHLNMEFPLKLAGRPLTEAYVGDPMANGELMVKLHADTGFDGLTLPATGFALDDDLIKMYALLYGDTMKMPGQDERVSADDSPPQFAEREIVTPADYDAIIATGWHAWCGENMDRISKSVFGVKFADAPMPLIAQGATAAYVAGRDAFAARGIPIIAGTNNCDPQMILSLARTLTGFSMDLYRCPDKVTKVLQSICKDITECTINSMLLSGPAPAGGLPGIMMACERGSGAYYNLKVFEKFIWPYMHDAIHAWCDAGFIVTLHLDTNWTKNFPYFRQLPKKKCILMLDSTSDIFKAKEVLGDHMCIMGDLPPALSTLGSVDEVDAYCKRLIQVVGKGGGLILGTGCAVPPETRIENFKAFVDSAKKYAAH